RDPLGVRFRRVRRGGFRALPGAPSLPPRSDRGAALRIARSRLRGATNGSVRNGTHKTGGHRPPVRRFAGDAPSGKIALAVAADRRVVQAGLLTVCTAGEVVVLAEIPERARSGAGAA